MLWACDLPLHLLQAKVDIVEVEVDLLGPQEEKL
jgi:hypothetical protein